VVATIGILSAIALPRFLTARQAAMERAVVANLRTMATNQQLFYTNPVPMKPSPLTDRTPRFARLNELNSYSRNVFGTTVSTNYVDIPGVRYSMVPLSPTITSLRGTFLIQATQQHVKKGFVYQVDESGRVVKIR
jgi:type II secretory pathway pseudopilin PulG